MAAFSGRGCPCWISQCKCRIVAYHPVSSCVKTGVNQGVGNSLSLLLLISHEKLSNAHIYVYILGRSYDFAPFFFIHCHCKSVASMVAGNPYKYILVRSNLKIDVAWNTYFSNIATLSPGRNIYIYREAEPRLLYGLYTTYSGNPGNHMLGKCFDNKHLVTVFQISTLQVAISENWPVLWTVLVVLGRRHFSKVPRINLHVSNPVVFVLMPLMCPFAYWQISQQNDQTNDRNFAWNILMWPVIYPHGHQICSYICITFQYILLAYPS